MINAQEALIYCMVMASAADGAMRDGELRAIGDAVTHLPVFDGFNPDHLIRTAQTCAKRLGEPNGLETTLDLIEAAIPEHLRETAFCLASDIAYSAHQITVEEERMLEKLRFRLRVGKLVAAALERGSRARMARLA